MLWLTCPWSPWAGPFHGAVALPDTVWEGQECGQTKKTLDPLGFVSDQWFQSNSTHVIQFIFKVTTFPTAILIKDFSQKIQPLQVTASPDKVDSRLSRKVQLSNSIATWSFESRLSFFLNSLMVVFPPYLLENCPAQTGRCQKNEHVQSQLCCVRWLYRTGSVSGP